MKIVTSQDLGALGAEAGKPVLVQWRWFNSKPTLGLWVALAVLLVVPRENRKWQAWLILVVPLFAAALRLIPSLGSSAGADALIQGVVTFAIAWAAVWLLAPYFSTGSRLRAIVSALLVMFAVGLAGYLTYFGFLFSLDTLGPAFCFWAVDCVSLLLALALSGACCRQTFHPGLIVAWLMLWLPVVTAIAILVGTLAAGLMSGGAGGLDAILIQIVMAVLFGSLFVAGGLYAVNLPVMILAGLTDCYRERLRAMVFRKSSGHNPFGQTPLVSDVPCEVVNT